MSLLEKICDPPYKEAVIASGHKVRTIWAESHICDGFGMPNKILEMTLVYVHNPKQASWCRECYKITLWTGNKCNRHGWDA